MADYTRAPAQAIPVVVVSPGATPLGYEQITVLTAAAGLTPPAGARYAIIQATGQDVRWRDDGTAPTATVGMTLAKSQPPFTYAGPLAAIQFIQTAASAVLDVTYYG